MKLLDKAITSSKVKLAEEFLPLLVMGQLAHVGKRAVFGLGRYRVVEP